MGITDKIKTSHDEEICDLHRTDEQNEADAQEMDALIAYEDDIARLAPRLK